MNVSSVADDPSTITLWSVNRSGREVRCDIETESRWSAVLGGTARLVVNGAPTDTRAFATVDELIALTADWRQRLAFAVGAWQ